MKIELKDSLENLYPDSKISKKPCRRMTLDVARGGIISVSILFNDLKEGQAVRVVLKRRGRSVKEAKWFRLIDVPVEANTGPVGSTEGKGERNRFVIRRAPFRVYDAMEPVKSSIRAQSSTMVVWMQLAIPTNVPAGKRDYTLDIQSGNETKKLSLIVNVHKVVIPSTGQDSFPYTNWFNVGQMAWRHGLEEWSEAHWRMIRRYADLMVYARQNSVMISLEDVFGGTRKTPVLDRQKLRRLVKTFTSAGIYYIEGGHLAIRHDRDWTSPINDIRLTGDTATSPAGNSALARITSQLMDEIDRNGWHDRWIQHVSDEPTDVNATDYRILIGMVRKYMPGIPIQDATMNPDLIGSVDMWCPQPHKYEKYRKRFEAQRAIGDRVWFYTCCYPGGPWLNRLLDMELLRPTLIGWAAALYDLDGFLHWGFNNCLKDQDPFEKSVVNPSGNFFLPAGDTHIAYPGKGRPWSSIRLEAQREGFEDYELLRKLMATNMKRASAIIQQAVRGFSDYTKDIKTFRTIRRKLLTAVSS